MAWVIKETSIMNKVRPAGEFVEDPEASCGAACPLIGLLGQVADDGRIADNFRVALSATRGRALALVHQISPLMKNICCL
jgi:hypothetical protein